MFVVVVHTKAGGNVLRFVIYNPISICKKFCEWLRSHFVQKFVHYLYILIILSGSQHKACKAVDWSISLLIVMITRAARFCSFCSRYVNYVIYFTTVIKVLANNNDIYTSNRTMYSYVMV